MTPYKVCTSDGGWLVEPTTKPLLTVLNYSGGRQSSALLWMILRGDIPTPESFLVLNADPGMENSETYKHVESMFTLCREAGIEAVRAEGPNLYDDLVQLRTSERKRIDNPPYWTRHPETGKEGKLGQKCTQQYKIRPMDRAMRRVLEERTGISAKSGRLPAGCVEKWIGFSHDELPRVKAPPQRYVRFAYPLIDLKMDNAAVAAYFEDNDLPTPPRSVCNACFANGLATLKEMHDNRPEDWAQAVAVDDAVRDLTQVGIRYDVFVSKSLIPLRDLPAQGFGAGTDADGWSCDSGYCFT